jgi:hypothetical protein
MTLHISYRHQCPQCGTEYIPFDTDVPCPKCGLVEADRYDFIRAAVDSSLFNIERYGSYIPWAWIELTFGDKVLSRVFRMLQAGHDHRDDGSFETLVDQWLGSEADWGQFAPHGNIQQDRLSSLGAEIDANCAFRHTPPNDHRTLIMTFNPSRFSAVSNAS